ncbi:MAG: hypothetical protein JNL58_29180 [Planctomyces sp.]|nr:hypothetical protein [Planctomyces sp.]
MSDVGEDWDRLKMEDERKNALASAFNLAVQVSYDETSPNDERRGYTFVRRLYTAVLSMLNTPIGHESFEINGHRFVNLHLEAWEKLADDLFHDSFLRRRFRKFAGWLLEKPVKKDEFNHTVRLYARWSYIRVVEKCGEFYLSRPESTVNSNPGCEDPVTKDSDNSETLSSQAARNCRKQQRNQLKSWILLLMPKGMMRDAWNVVTRHRYDISYKAYSKRRKNQRSAGWKVVEMENPNEVPDTTQTLPDVNNDRLSLRTFIQRLSRNEQKLIKASMEKNKSENWLQKAASNIGVSESEALRLYAGARAKIAAEYFEK